MSASEAAVSRDKYTWAHAVNDITLNTPLRWSDVYAITRPLDGLVHPYDAVPHLTKILNPEHSVSVRAHQLAALIRAAVEHTHPTVHIAAGPDAIVAACGMPIVPGTVVATEPEYATCVDCTNAQYETTPPANPNQKD